MITFEQITADLMKVPVEMVTEHLHTHMQEAAKQLDPTVAEIHYAQVPTLDPYQVYDPKVKLLQDVCRFVRNPGWNLFIHEFDVEWHLMRRISAEHEPSARMVAEKKVSIEMDSGALDLSSTQRSTIINNILRFTESRTYADMPSRPVCPLPVQYDKRFRPIALWDQGDLDAIIMQLMGSVWSMQCNTLPVEKPSASCNLRTKLAAPWQSAN